MMTWTRLIACAFLVLGVAGGSSIAEGQVKPKRVLIKEANVHYENGKDHHKHGEYPAAAVEYAKAYAIYPNPDFLFNLAQAERLGGDKASAVDNYKKYLTERPNGRGAADARAQVAALEIELAKEEAEQAEAKRLKDEAAAAAAELRRKEEAAQEARLLAAQEERQTQGPPETMHEANGSRALRIAGIATFGAGIVSLGFGIKFGLDAQSLESEVEDNTVWDQDAFDEGESTARDAMVLYGIGGVAISAGAIMYLIGRDSSEKPATQSRASLRPVVTRSGPGLLVQGTF